MPSDWSGRTPDDAPQLPKRTAEEADYPRSSGKPDWDQVDHEDVTPAEVRTRGCCLTPLTGPHDVWCSVPTGVDPSETDAVFGPGHRDEIVRHAEGSPEPVRSGQEVEVRLHSGESTEPLHHVSLSPPSEAELDARDARVAAKIRRAAAVRWSPADLDRCEHGRHSIDSCYDCPGGLSHGNPFLLTPVPVGNDHPENVRVVDGRIEVRIGTMVRGEPIWVVVRDKPREAQMTEQPADDGKLPCSECGHRVRPGRHTVAECIRNQQDDAAEQPRTAYPVRTDEHGYAVVGDDETEEQTDGD